MSVRVNVAPRTGRKATIADVGYTSVRSHAAPPGDDARAQPTMPISRDEVRHIARLANLEFSEAEQERFTRQLSAILDYVAHLDRLDTGGIEPTSHAGDEAAALRDDAPRPTLSSDEALANAPDPGRGLFKVPRVLG